MTTLTDTQVVTASGGLVELGYQSTDRTNVAVSATTSSGATELVSTTVVCDGGPILIEFQCCIACATGEGVVFRVWVDGVDTAGFAGNTNSQTNRETYFQTVRLQPAAGSRTISIRWYRWTGSTSLTSITGNAILRVSKIVQATQWPAVTTGTIICTSSTRPASPFEGQTIYETDTDSTYTYSGSAWALTGTLGSGFVTASSTTAQGPAGSLTYIHATITVTPGVWIVNSAMSVFNATTSDGTSVGIYNRTTSAIVSGSMGVPRETSTSSSGYAALHSAPTKIVVSSNTDLCPYATRNGASNLQTTNWTGLHSQGVPTGLITAQRLYGG